MPRRKGKLPRMKVMGKYFEVTRLSKKIPKTIRVGSKVEPVKKRIYRLLWAVSHMSGAEKKRQTTEYMRRVHKG